MTEKRIMRLTWNANNWEVPSGHPWKEQNQGSTAIAYENQYGFGNEEWLFNERYRVDGFQYGYIRGVQNLNAELENIDKLVLYTISDSKQRYIVGILNNVTIIEGDEIEEDFIKSVKDKYFDDIVDELKAVNADYEYFQSGEDRFLPNIKFKWEEAEFHEPVPVSFLDGPAFNRFQAYHLNEEIEQLVDTEVQNEKLFVFIAGRASTSSGYNKTNTAGMTKVSRRHSDITESLYDYHLSNDYKKNQLSAEKTRVGGNIIDFAVKENSDEVSIFEIKTSPIAIKNIRQAIGQLLEYALLSNQIKINKLVIVGPAALKKGEKDYFDRLAGTISLPLEYWAYFESNKKKERFIKQQDEPIKG